MSLHSAYDIFSTASSQALDWFQQETVGLRTGRIKPEVVEGLPIEHYGARTPIKGLATIANADARTLVISPWDPGAVASIKKAIIEAQIGVQPTEDGKVLRLSFPMQTEESRAQTIKVLHKKAEETRIKFRQGRDAALSVMKTEKQKAIITEDDFYEGKEKLDHLIATANEQVESLVEKKEKEIKTI